MTSGVAYTDEQIEKLGKDLLVCVNEEGVWHMSVFAERNQKSDGWLYEIARDHPVFKEYMLRARKILGHKILNQAMTAKPDNWMVKLLYKRLMNTKDEPVEDWVRQDLMDEAKAKADATKAVLTEIHPAMKKIIEELDKDAQ